MCNKDSRLELLIGLHFKPSNIRVSKLQVERKGPKYGNSEGLEERDPSGVKGPEQSKGI